MRCIYLNFSGECTLWEEGNDDECMGCDSEGFCMVEDDPDPSRNCYLFEDPYPDLESDDWC